MYICMYVNDVNNVNNAAANKKKKILYRKNVNTVQRKNELFIHQRIKGGKKKEIKEKNKRM